MQIDLKFKVVQSEANADYSLVIFSRKWICYAASEIVLLSHGGAGALPHMLTGFHCKCKSIWGK